SWRASATSGRSRRRQNLLDRGSEVMSGTAKMVSNLVGTRLGDRYVLEEKIGAGGFAVVYRARDTRISKQVAVKVLDRSKVQNLRDIARFRNEAAIAAAIDDDHIIKITDYGE